MNEQGNMDSGWKEYGRLVLAELERLNEAQSETNRSIQEMMTKIGIVEKEVDAHRKVDEQVFKELADDIKEINEKWQNYVDKVNEVWSPTQMQQVKNEVYRHKTQMTRWAGVVITISVLINMVIAFKDYIFGK